ISLWQRLNANYANWANFANAQKNSRYTCTPKKHRDNVACGASVSVHLWLNIPMTIHLLNCFTCNARCPSKLKTGMACLLIETDQGLILMDTGLGLDDYTNPAWMTQLFRVLTIKMWAQSTTTEHPHG
ncbi:MAG: hypothetical protein Q7T89_04775, partial [Anaerolineales bacterium]|nr:hypothetical protein [Anaerolineales bacterium]